MSDREETLARALHETTVLLFDLWRSATDEEREALAPKVGRAVQLYARKPWTDE